MLLHFNVHFQMTFLTSIILEDDNTVCSNFIHLTMSKFIRLRRCLLQILVVTLVAIGAVFTIIFHVGTKEDVSRKRKRPALTENGVNQDLEDSTKSLEPMRWSGWLREHQFYQVCQGHILFFVSAVLFVVFFKIIIYNLSIFDYLFVSL